MTELVKRYRRNAVKCLELAQTFNEPEAKRELVLMANAWLSLAAQREKNIQTALPSEPPSPVKPPSIDDPPKPPPMRLDPAKSDDPMQS